MELVRKACSFILGMSSSNGDELEPKSPSKDSESSYNDQVACIDSEDKDTTDSLIDDSQHLTPDPAPQTTGLLQDPLQQSDTESVHESMEEPISPAFEVAKSESESSIQDTEETVKDYATTDMDQSVPANTASQETTYDDQPDKQTKAKKRQHASLDVYAGYSQPSKKQRKRKRKVQHKILDQAAKSFNDVVVHYDQDNIPQDLYKYVNLFSSLEMSILTLNVFIGIICSDILISPSLIKAYWWIEVNIWIKEC